MLVYLAIINIISLFTMWIDKRKARKNKWRIPEGRIWFFAIIGGALGATIGMYVCRHKTKHTLFLIGLPFIAIIQWLLIIIFFL